MEITMSPDIGEYLLISMAALGWSQAELARRAGVSRTAISNVIAGKRQIGKDLANALAKALGEPPEVIYRAAGLLPDLHDQRAALEEILGYKLSELTDNQLDEVIQFISWIQHREQPQVKQSRQGLHPGELVK